MSEHLPSEATLLAAIRRKYSAQNGVTPRWVHATHVRADAGYDQRAADALALDCWPSGGHTLHGFEVKISRSDWLRELRDPTKADSVKRYCDRWWLVAPPEVARREELPDGWGWLRWQSDTRPLVTAAAAPALSPEPWPRGFVVALARAAVQTQKRRDSDRELAATVGL